LTLEILRQPAKRLLPRDAMSSGMETDERAVHPEKSFVANGGDRTWDRYGSQSGAVFKGTTLDGRNGVCFTAGDVCRRNNYIGQGVIAALRGGNSASVVIIHGKPKTGLGVICRN